ncbi:MAG: DUF4855 domain-containing protein [Bacteroidota bacterium]|nr:DUF4855 domain-containing protein [Bacteroidota bacterium]MDP4205843.1 DUF4855 domain-containing protein [Bacteroidota bacterium]
MVKKNIFAWVVILLFSIGFASAFPNSSTGKQESNKSKKISSSNPISDLVLIYHGGAQRLPWSANQLRPYVYQDNSTKFNWLFDGFLFLEIFDSVNKYNYDPGFQYRTAGKEQWEWLLNRYFGKQKGPDALESILDSLAKVGKKPVRKRMVVISIPCPVPGYKDWGELDGKKLDFTNSEDRELASKWFIDKALKMWNERGYKHIKLAGFYWVHEAAEKSDKAISGVKDYLKSQNMKLFWIPYWGAKGKDSWAQLGFDYAYQQPNYFFSTKIPESRLNDACAFSRKYGLGLEMEFDERVAQPDFRTRFYDYLNAFEKNRVWEDLPVAYYEGGGAWLQMANSKDQEMQKMYNTLSNIIVKRQVKTDKALKK